MAVGACILVFATVVVVLAFAGRRLPDLAPWHKSGPASEFRARDAAGGFEWADYFALEDKVFQEAEEYWIPESEGGGSVRFSRYLRGGPDNPATFDTNWNRSFELVPSEVRGGVLLVHGLSDSPYSVRSVAQFLHGEGFYVLGLRLPGHGTTPGALLDVSLNDWTAAVRLAARHVEGRLEEGMPFYFGGYSCGGALAVHYALTSLKDERLRTPDRLILLSPAIGITPFARAANWHRALSWIPYFEKSAWESVLPEYDPYKYNSFTKNAGAQMFALTQAVQRELATVVKRGDLDSLPPMLTFQSLADSTVSTQAIVDNLYRHLDDRSELVLFDVNTISYLREFQMDAFAALPRNPANATVPYQYTLVTNVTGDTRQVHALTKRLGSGDPLTTSLAKEWPTGVFSLTHVAIPFSPDDPIYGKAPSIAADGGLPIGALAPRGEKNVLLMPASLLMRLRYNPFHDFMLARIGETVRP